METFVLVGKINVSMRRFHMLIRKIIMIISFCGLYSFMYSS